MPATDSPQARFAALGLTLPPAPKPIGVYTPSLVVGPHILLSGHGPLLPDGTLMRGRVGRDLDANGGKQAARQVGLTMLAIAGFAVGVAHLLVRRIARDAIG
jgi:hypothetical protein